MSSPDITTSVAEDFVVPITFHVFNFLRSGSALRTIPLIVAIVATKSAAGTAVVGTVYDVNDAATTDALSGVNSEGAMMCRQAMACTRLFRRGPKLVATFIDANAAGTVNVQTITPVGTATAEGAQVIIVAGRTFTVGVHLGDNAATNAAAIFAELKTAAETLPVTLSLVGSAVTLTHPTKGINGRDVLVTVNVQVSGIVATVATTAVGAGACDITPALTALSPSRYDGIAIANHAAADITAFGLDIQTRWAPESKTWGFYYMFEPGTIGTATALAAAANDKSIIVSNFEGCLNGPGEGAVTSAVLVGSRPRANSSFDDALVPLYPPAKGLWYTAPERNTAIKAGLTVYVGTTDSTGAVISDRAKCVQMVTSKTTLNGFPDDRLRDIAVPRTGVEIATQLDIAVADLRANNPDGISQSTALTMYRDVAAAILRAETRSKPPVLNPEFLEDDVQALLTQADSDVNGRVNGRIPYHPDVPNHQVAWYHDVVVGS